MIYKAEKGEVFYQFGQRMQEEMKKNNQLYRQCVFNDIYFTISSDSNMDDIATIYDLKRKYGHNS